MKNEKKCKVLLLPTNEKASSLSVLNSGKLNYGAEAMSSINTKLQHLYFLSDEEIKEGDWVYCLKEGFEPVLKQKVNPIGVNNDKMFKKIIATTDKSLIINSIYGVDSFDTSIFSGSGKSEIVKLPQMFNLPQPSQSFIEKFVEEYNKGNVITEVMVEYEKYIGKNYVGEFTTEKDFDYKLKVNSKDNTITIVEVENV